MKHTTYYIEYGHHTVSFFPRFYSHIWLIGVTVSEMEAIHLQVHMNSCSKVMQMLGVHCFKHTNH